MLLIEGLFFEKKMSTSLLCEEQGGFENKKRKYDTES